MLENANVGVATVHVPNNADRKLATRAPKVTSDFLQGVPTGFPSFIRDPACGAFIDRQTPIGAPMTSCPSESFPGSTLFYVMAKPDIEARWLPEQIAESGFAEHLKLEQ